MITEWHLLDTGYCSVRESHAYPGGGSRTVPCHAVVALLRHEQHGWLLFDTGYAPRVIDATRHFPERLYALATPLHLTGEHTIAQQIARFGLRPEDIGTVIVSHFHADHIGGLHDFPSAQFICSRTAYDRVHSLSGIAAVRKAFLPALMPDDFTKRARFLTSLPREADIFGDRSLQVIDLPGHAAGQIGLLATTIDKETLLFVADAAYSSQAIREHIAPHPVTRLFTDNWYAAQETLTKLHTYYQENPETILLPTHCPETYARCTR